MEITAKVVGAEQVVKHFTTLSDVMRQRIVDRMDFLGHKLRNKVVDEKLRGQVLNVRTDRLRGNINLRAEDTSTTISRSVGTNVPYGRWWEEGFTVPAHDIEPKEAKALFWPGAPHPVRRVHQDARTVAARPFLAPSLAEMRDEIRARLVRAIAGEA